MNNIFQYDYHIRESIRSIKHALNEDLALQWGDESEFLRKKKKNEKCKINRLRHIERRRNAKSPLISVRNVHSTTTAMIRRRKTKKSESFFFLFRMAMLQWTFQMTRSKNKDTHVRRKKKKSSSMCYCC